MKCLKFLKISLISVLCLINCFLSFSIEIQGSSFGNPDPIMDIFEGLNKDLNTNENIDKVHNFDKTHHELKDLKENEFLRLPPLRIENFMRPMNPFKNLMKKNNNEPQIFESSGPGFHVIEIKNPFGGPINLSSSSEHHENKNRINNIFDFQNSANSEIPSPFPFKDMDKDPFENIFSSKPKVHVQVFRIPKRKFLQTPGNAPAPGRLLNGFDQMLEGFFDGFAKGLIGDEIEQNIKKHQEHHDSDKKIINKDFDDLNKVFDDFFGNDHKDSPIKQHRLKKNSNKNEKTKIKLKNPKKLNDINNTNFENTSGSGNSTTISSQIHNESQVKDNLLNSLPKSSGIAHDNSNINNHSELNKTTIHDEIKNITKSTASSPINIVSSPSPLNSTLTYNSTNNSNKNGTNEKWWSKFTDIKSHKLLSYSLKYSTYILLIILIGIIAYTCLFFVFKSNNIEGKSEKASFTADEIEDELKSINKNRHLSGQKYY